MANEVDTFLEDLKGGEKNEDPFKQEATDPLAEVPKEEVKEEEKVPFHKDEKVQKFIEREIDRRVSKIQPTEIIREVVAESPETSELKDILTRIIGNDTPEKIAAVKDFEKALGGLEEKGAQRAMEQIQRAKDEEYQAEMEAQNELASGFSDIEDKFDIDLTSNKSSAKALRSDFVDFITRISPKDEDGNVMEFPDLPETFQLFKETRKPESNNRAKELSSRSMTRSGDASTAPVQKDNSWRAVDKMLGKLLG